MVYELDHKNRGSIPGSIKFLALSLSPSLSLSLFSTASVHTLGRA